MSREDLAQAAKDVVLALDKLPSSGIRAEHKINMIRIAEKVHAGMAIDEAAASEQIFGAAAFAGI